MLFTGLLLAGRAIGIGKALDCLRDLIGDSGGISFKDLSGVSVKVLDTPMVMSVTICKHYYKDSLNPNGTNDFAQMIKSRLEDPISVAKLSGYSFAMTDPSIAKTEQERIKVANEQYYATKSSKPDNGAAPLKFSGAR